MPRLLTVRPELGREILEPILRGTVRDVLALCSRALVLLGPPVPPAVPWLPDLVEWQLQPRRGADGPRPPASDRDLVRIEDEPRYFPATVQTAAEALLATVQTPIALSALLGSTAHDHAGRAVRDYLILRALEATAPEPPANDDPGGLAWLPLRATRHGPLDTSEFVGDDLLLAQIDTVPIDATGGDDDAGA